MFKTKLDKYKNYDSIYDIIFIGVCLYRNT